MNQTNTRVRKDQDPSPLLERLQQYAILVRLNRPIGILLLLWPTLWALWIAGDGKPDLLVTVVFVLGVALMRSAGCAINDFADRHIDGEVKRTCQRPIATGRVSPREALMVFAVLSLAAFGLVLLLSWPTVLMSAVALVLAAVYPFMKRYTHLPQLVLGMAFGWAVPMAYMALTGTVSPEAWLLYIATVMWALIYDTQYAMVDREDDLRIGVKSTAILFGDSDISIIGMIQLFMICLLILVGVKEELGVYYFLGVVVASLLAVYQQYLIRDRDPAGCFAAFLNNNYFGLVVFLGIVIDFAVRS